MAQNLELGLFKNYIRNNLRKAKPVPFKLTFDEFKKLVTGNCYLCGKPPTQIYYKNYAARIFYNGIDRVDNKIGYVASNCQACCKKCNSVKSDMPLADLKVHLKKMLEYL